MPLKVKILTFRDRGDPDQSQLESEINTFLAGNVEVISVLQSSTGEIIESRYTTITIFYEEKMETNDPRM